MTVKLGVDISDKSLSSIGYLHRFVFSINYVFGLCLKIKYLYIRNNMLALSCLILNII